MPQKTKKKGKKKTAKKKACCAYEEHYKEEPYESKIMNLVRCGILQDIEAIEHSPDPFEQWIGETDVLASEYDRVQTMVDPSLLDVRNYAVEFGVLPLGCPALRETDKFGYVPSILLYGPSGSGKTTLARSIAISCGARWFDLSPARICESGICTSKEDIEKIVHLTFHVAKYLKPSVIYVDEIEKIFEGGKGHTGPHPTFLLSALKTHIKKSITKISRVLVIGASSKPFIAKELKAMKDLFTVDDENRQMRHMCFCPWPDNTNRVLLWRKFIQEALGEFKERSKIQLYVSTMENSGHLDLNLLAKCSEGYTAGSIRQAVFQCLSYRRIQKYLQLKKIFQPEEFLEHLSKTEYCYAEDRQNFHAFRAEMICRGDAKELILAKREALLNGDQEEPKKKKGGKKKK